MARLAKRKDNLWLFYFVAGIAILITLLVVVGNYSPIPLPMHATNQFTLDLNCDSISITVNTIQGKQTTNNTVYAVNKATGMQYEVKKTDQADLQLPISIENPIIRRFTIGTIPSGTYDVFLKDANNSILGSLLNSEKTNCQ